MRNAGVLGSTGEDKRRLFRRDKVRLAYFPDDTTPTPHSHPQNQAHAQSYRVHHRPVAIPDEMAVVSVDGIHEICLNVTPNLTSVNLNFFQCGENAVELLEPDGDRPYETVAKRRFACSKAPQSAL